MSNCSSGVSGASKITDPRRSQASVETPEHGSRFNPNLHPSDPGFQDNLTKGIQKYKEKKTRRVKVSGGELQELLKKSRAINELFSDDEAENSGALQPNLPVPGSPGIPTFDKLGFLRDIREMKFPYTLRPQKYTLKKIRRM